MSFPSASRRSYQLDVVDQVGHAFRVVINNARLVAELALLPFLIVLGAAVLSVLVPGAGMVSHVLAGLIHALGFLLFGSVFLVRWYRFLLLGENFGEGLIPPGWTDFLVAGVKLGVLMVAGWAALSLVGLVPPRILTIPLAALGGVTLLLLSLRVSLIFPAAAIRRPVALRTAWDWIAGNFWRLFVAAFACFLPFAVAQMVIGAIAGTFPALMWIVFEAATLAVSFAGAAVVAALLAHVYQDIADLASPA
jgi:hypothetical protein